MINYIKFVSKAPYDYKQVMEFKSILSPVKFPSKSHTRIRVQLFDINGCTFETKKKEKHAVFKCI